MCFSQAARSDRLCKSAIKISENYANLYESVLKKHNVSLNVVRVKNEREREKGKGYQSNTKIKLKKKQLVI